MEQKPAYEKLEFPVVVSGPAIRETDLALIEKDMRRKNVAYGVGKIRDRYVLCRALDSEDLNNVNLMKLINKDHTKSPSYKPKKKERALIMPKVFFRTWYPVDEK